MKPQNQMTAELILNIEERTSVSKKNPVWNWVQRWLIKPMKHWRASMELRRKIAELDDHLLRDVGLHDTTYAAECRMRRTRKILHPMF